MNIGRIEDKMGCHGSPTCEINFDAAEGYLIGTENRGLNHMFTFINTSRLGTAIQGLAAAELAFQNSLWCGNFDIILDHFGPFWTILDHGFLGRLSRRDATSHARAV